MFKVDDMVLYGTDGICKIAAIAKKTFYGDSPVDYYVLKPIYKGNATIFVPVNNETLTSKMRRVLSPTEIQSFIQELPEECPMWIEDENARKSKYKEIIASGDHRQIIKLIKALYEHQQEQYLRNKKLHLSDERLLKSAEKIIYDEFAFILQIPPEEVLPFIMKQLQDEPRHSQDGSRRAQDAQDTLCRIQDAAIRHKASEKS